MRDRDRNAYILLGHKDALFIVYCHHLQTDRSFYHGTLVATVEKYYEDVKIQMLDKDIKFIMNHSAIEKVHQFKMADLPAGGVCIVLGVVLDRVLREGDTVGVGVDLETLECGFRINGLLVGEEFGIKGATVLLPYIRDVPRYRINYGTLGFFGNYSGPDNSESALLFV